LCLDENSSRVDLLNNHTHRLPTAYSGKKPVPLLQGCKVGH
jgi:hypothetical protein